MVTDGRSGSFYPDTGLLRFPLRPGMRYSAQFEVVRPRQSTFDSKVTLGVQVVGWEEVSVPAGRFRALKLEATGSYERQDKEKQASGAMRYVIWYVPGLKRWAKFTLQTDSPRRGAGTRQTEELLSYRVQ